MSETILVFMKSSFGFFLAHPDQCMRHATG
jgi:hypothetical protein